MTDVTKEPEREKEGAWQGAVPDLLAFGAGLLGGAWMEWNTSALVWSLWLSSLVVGFATLVVVLLRAAWSTGSAPGARLGQEAGTRIAVWGGALFLLGFFTVHFGGFHFVHSVFLQQFFPVEGTPRGRMPDEQTYWMVLKQNAWFLPLALVAQREVFWPKKSAADVRTAEEIKAEVSAGMFAPYKNVVRLHLLIFFFAFAMFLRLPAALIFIVVYAVYFFPWRVVKERRGRRQAAEG